MTFYFYFVFYEHLWIFITSWNTKRILKYKTINKNDVDSFCIV